MTPSARNLILANAATLGLAVTLEWDIGWLMRPFWMQSVIIGVYAYRRMMSLRDFTTKGLMSNKQPVPETEAGKRSTARFFALHFGAFHAGYLAFLVSEHTVTAPIELLALAGCGLSFLFSQRQTFEAQHAADLQGRPNLGKLMFLPYVRIVPMHLGIIFGASLDGGVMVLTGFVVLKTIADLALDHADRRMAVEKAAGAERA
ncbi:hypothetical protein C0099_05645 [Pseudazoarcus pumilus]|uniref:Uncharacterized protein n=2 Tax=Pseudazoarcus pumilus TaxID=2067960 RepID=A0A2I6S5D4_9RHOO|nr:DUF6498-containing protein [Pseudazoarcus pumilus]AUN94470.1 hypothetical protein C0099_05645 [Pseudazoarcus pumilus]